MNEPRHSRRAALAVCGLLLAALTVGCSQGNFIKVRRAPRNPLAGPLQLFSIRGPQPTMRTEQLLRRYDLVEQRDENKLVALASLEQEVAKEPYPETVYSIAELAYIDGQQATALGRDEEALDYFGAAVGHAYWYLFDSKLDLFRNPYDPQFRQTCDLYNGALEAALRIVQKRGRLKPGGVETIRTARRQFELAVEVRGPWSPSEIERLEFVSEFEVVGLTNHHHTYGLGVPLIAVRRPSNPNDPRDKFYPKQLSFPVTAFLRAQRQLGEIQPTSTSAADTNSTKAGTTSGNQAGEVATGEQPVTRYVLELHDPLSVQHIRVGERLVPLETDFSTALAYFLNSTERSQEALALLGLFKPTATEKAEGIYMLEPYSPNKIPVLMVHGLWSSPMTWMEMFNDLRALPEIRDHYQFWFYLYPTGRPFWNSAAELRSELRAMKQLLDPNDQSPALPQMVLVGHSMGGLLSMMQTVESGDEFWRTVSHRPFDELNAEDDARERLRNVAFFEPNPLIRRVITIGTPHHGSTYANDYTRWLSHKLITLPQMVLASNQKLIRDNPGYFHHNEMLTVTTSIDSLSPECPMIKVLRNAPRSPSVQYHNIVGLVPKQGFWSALSAGGDGVVSYESAHLTDVDSEIVVPADHVNVHRHPRAILEVRRILLDHLAETQFAPLAGAEGATRR